MKHIWFKEMSDTLHYLGSTDFTHTKLSLYVLNPPVIFSVQLK